MDNNSVLKKKKNENMVEKAEVMNFYLQIYLVQLPKLLKHNHVDTRISNKLMMLFLTEK